MKKALIIAFKLLAYIVLGAIAIAAFLSYSWTD